MNKLIIKDLEGCNVVSKIIREINNVKIFMVTLEQYFFRTSSVNSLSILITDDGIKQIADIIASGGGDELFRISLGSNRAFAQQVKNVLDKLDFEVKEELHKGFLMD